MAFLRRATFVFLAVAATGCASGTASVGVLSPSGDAFEDLDAAAALELVSTKPGQGFHLGTGLGFGIHATPEGFDDVMAGSLFLEPRYTIGDDFQRIAPFVFGRAGATGHGVDTETMDFGLLYGGGAGVTFYFHPRFGVQGQAGWFSHSVYSDLTEETTPGSKTVFSLGLSWR